MARATIVESIGDVIDRAIAEVAQQEFQRLRRGLSEEEIVGHVHRALEELKKLGEGGTPAYDCEWVALFYLTWYQPRHINLVYSILDQTRVELPRRLHVVDLGCGAMAVQFAMAVFAATSDQTGTRVSLTGIDISRPMIAIGVELWNCFRKMIREEANGFRTPETIHQLDRVTTTMSKECRTLDSLDRYRRSFDEVICAEADRRAAEDRSNSPPYLIRQRAIRTAWDRLAAHSTHWLTSIHAVYHLPEELRAGCNLLNPKGILLTADGPRFGDVATIRLFEEVEVEPKRHGCLPHTTRWRRKLNGWLRRRHSYLDRDGGVEPTREQDRGGSCPGLGDVPVTDPRQLTLLGGSNPGDRPDEPRGQSRPARLGHATIDYKPAGAILTRATGFMDAYDFTLNPYVGCAFGCTYCYAAFFSRASGSITGAERRDTWGQWVEVKENAIKLLERRRKRLDGTLIYMSSVTDPYQPIERKLKLTRGLLELLAKRHRPKTGRPDPKPRCRARHGPLSRDCR